MARKPNGGIIGQFSLPSSQQAVGVYRATEAGLLSSAGQFPGANTAAVIPQTVVQTGNIVKPTITSLYYCDNNYTNINPGSNAGLGVGFTLRIFGQNFTPNTQIWIGGNLITIMK